MVRKDFASIGQSSKTQDTLIQACMRATVESTYTVWWSGTVPTQNLEVSRDSDPGPEGKKKGGKEDKREETVSSFSLFFPFSHGVTVLQKLKSPLSISTDYSASSEHYEVKYIEGA